MVTSFDTFTLIAMSGRIRWMPFDELEELNTFYPSKILSFLTIATVCDQDM